MHEVTLRTGDVEIAGWTSVSIRKSLDQLADEFSFELTNARLNTGVTPDFVRRAADELTRSGRVEVHVDGKKVVTGYIDDHGFSYSGRSARLVVSGRSKTGDLCDCSAFRGEEAFSAEERKKGVKKGRFLWEKATLAQIAGDLCSPYRIQVLVKGVDMTSKQFRRFRIEPGESVFDALSRAAELRGALPITTPDGDIAFVRSSGISSGAVLELGVNVLEGGCERTLRGRYSDYLFRGQTFSNDTLNGINSAELSGTIDDAGVPRYRPLLVLGDHQHSNEDLGVRAIWERNVRAGRSVRHRYTVEGWKNSAGHAWETNTLVHIKDPWCGFDAEKLVCSIEYVLNGDEYLSRLELVDATAFIPDKEKKVRLPSMVIGEMTSVTRKGKTQVFEPVKVGVEAAFWRGTGRPDGT